MHAKFMKIMKIKSTIFQLNNFQTSKHAFRFKKFSVYATFYAESKSDKKN